MDKELRSSLLMIDMKDDKLGFGEGSGRQCVP